MCFAPWLLCLIVCLAATLKPPAWDIGLCIILFFSLPWSNDCPTSLMVKTSTSYCESVWRPVWPAPFMSSAKFLVFGSPYLIQSWDILYSRARVKYLLQNVYVRILCQNPTFTLHDITTHFSTDSRKSWLLDPDSSLPQQKQPTDWPSVSVHASRTNNHLIDYTVTFDILALCPCKSCTLITTIIEDV